MGDGYIADGYIVLDLSKVPARVQLYCLLSGPRIWLEVLCTETSHLGRRQGVLCYQLLSSKISLPIFSVLFKWPSGFHFLFCLGYRLLWILFYFSFFFLVNNYFWNMRSSLSKDRLLLHKTSAGFMYKNYGP